MLPIKTFSSSPSISNFISTHPHLTLLETQCKTTKDLHQIHAQIIKTGLHRDPFALSRLLNFCCTSPFPDLTYALLLFSHSPDPTNFMYNSLIRAFSKSTNPHLSISLFHHMLHSNHTQPNRLTYPSVFAAFTCLNSAHEGGRTLHALVIKHGCSTDTYIHNAILHMYAACGLLDDACKLFEACNLVSCNSFILGLAKKGFVHEARKVFDEMPARNEVTWSTMISGYVRNDMNVEALDLFKRMQMERVVPNEHVLVSLLSVCACLGALELGEWIYRYVDRMFEIDNNSIMSTKVIEMYCKCGRLDKAKDIFDGLSVKVLSTWNVMILGLALHGHGREGVELFVELEGSGLRPDHVSFVCVLMACNHSGLVDEARNYFRKMYMVYNLEPRIEHYGCLVDVLGRAGLIEEAEDMIERMNVKPDKVIWTSFLKSCVDYDEMERAKKAMSKIVELDPYDSGGYVILSNGYAREGEFGESVKERMRMNERGVRKDPGSSVVEVNGGVHEFVVGGISHCESGEIRCVLDGLILNMRDEYAA